MSTFTEFETRPNPERDLLAGYEFPLSDALGNQVMRIIDVYAPSFATNRTSVDGHNLKRPAGDRIIDVQPGTDGSVPGRLEVVSAFTGNVVTFENESEYWEEINTAKLKVADVFTQARTDFIDYLVSRGRSPERAETIVSRRFRPYLFDLTAGSNYLLGNDGKPRDNVTDIGLTTTDRICDLVLEGSDDEYAPTIRNISDETRLLIFRLVFTSAKE